MRRFMVRGLIIAALLSCSHVNKDATAVSTIEPVNQAAECPLYISLTGAISDPSEFISKLEACRGSPVVVEINSPGGSIFGALEIQKAIERHDRPVYCVVDGMAASAAFVTLQSCDVRFMTERSVLMAHHASSSAAGQSHEVDNVAAALKAIDRALVLQCSHRMKMSPDEFESHVSGGREWWMSVDDAIQNRAVDFPAADINEVLRLVFSK